MAFLRSNMWTPFLRTNPNNQTNPTQYRIFHLKSTTQDEQMTYEIILPLSSNNLRFWSFFMKRQHFLGRIQDQPNIVFGNNVFNKYTMITIAFLRYLNDIIYHFPRKVLHVSVFQLSFRTSVVVFFGKLLFKTFHFFLIR